MLMNNSIVYQWLQGILQRCNVVADLCAGARLQSHRHSWGARGKSQRKCSRVCHLCKCAKVHFDGCSVSTCDGDQSKLTGLSDSKRSQSWMVMFFTDNVYRKKLDGQPHHEFALEIGDISHQLDSCTPSNVFLQKSRSLMLRDVRTSLPERFHQKKKIRTQWSKRWGHPSSTTCVIPSDQKCTVGLFKRWKGRIWGGPWLTIINHYWPKLSDN